MSVKWNDSTPSHWLASKISETCSEVEMGLVTLGSGSELTLSQVYCSERMKSKTGKSKLLRQSIVCIGECRGKQRRTGLTRLRAFASCLYSAVFYRKYFSSSWGPGREVERKTKGQFAMPTARQIPRWPTLTLAAALDGRCDRSLG